MSYINISAMEPMLPLPLSEKMEALAIEIIRQSAGLASTLHPITQLAVKELVREMNCYYSNLIEGHKTKPLDIQKVLKHEFLTDPKKQALQKESFAHIQAQKEIESKLESEPNIEICSTEFIGWIHQEFYRLLPECFKIVETDLDATDIKVVPGFFRTRAVQVGNHIPPDSNYLKSFMDRFFVVYEPKNFNAVMQIVAAAASHHRLAWIHPFIDGNGRVVRLFSDAYFKKVKIDSHGLWTISRGLAKNRNLYMESLAKADTKRQNDFDGRGNLSLKGLEEFCIFFLETALDQIKYMASQLELTGLENRVEATILMLSKQEKFDENATFLLKTILLRGEVARGEVSRITSLPERTARNLIRKLLDLDLLTSPSPKGMLRLGLPFSVVNYYFPNLYT